MNWLKQKWLWLVVAVRTALLTRAIKIGRADMEMILGVVRALLAAAGGYMINQGWADQGTVDGLIGAVIVVIAGIWSIISKAKAK
jgi:hypothetical protein